MNLESTKVNVTKSSKEVFEFLIHLENFEQLMPENTQKFEVDGDSFLFALKGMPEIVLKKKTAAGDYFYEFCNETARRRRNLLQILRKAGY